VGRPGARHPEAHLRCMSVGVTLDAGGLIALDRGDRRVLVLLARASETNAPVTVPATALAQVVRRPVGQVRLMRLLRQPTTSTVPLDRVDATRVGLLLAATETADIADAHVVVCARRAGQRVVTSDPDDIARFDPDLELVIV
jgi:predicted nucleic acid-binding protein